MHIQIRTVLNTAGFTDDNGRHADGSVSLAPGSLSDLLAVLARRDSDADPEFSLAAASGHDIELGGVFSFWVHPRDGVDADHEEATQRAMERIRGAGYDADPFVVEHRNLSDTAGTLKEFVDEVTAKRLHVVEISIGTPGPDGIPVQIYTAQTR
jgi:hypothetical protein